MYLINRKIKSQITRYLAGECNPEEKRVIFDLVKNNPEYRKVYDQLSKTWEFISPKADSTIFDVDSAWNKLNSRIAQPSAPVRNLKPVHKTGDVRKLYKYAIRIAAVFLIGLAVFQLVNTGNRLETLASGKDLPASLSLEDGSSVFLNSSSVIKYHQKFGDQSREVYFWGEAFFEVASDPTRPFIIESGETRVKVLGTSFNVKAYPEAEKVEVVVNSGEVLFYHVDREEQILGQVTLQQGEKGIYFRKTRQIARIPNDEPNYLSWKTGILVFNETSLDKVLEAIGQKYKVTVKMETNDLEKLKLTATFDNEPLDAVLEVLTLVHNLQIVNNGKDYLVKKKTG